MRSHPSSPERDRDPDRLRRLNALLEVALALPEADRTAWLHALPPEHQPFAAVLGVMLARASVETDTFLREPVRVGFDELAQMDVPPDQAGDRVGPYRLIRELGAGGMATVWLAERADGVLQREVALKLPRAGWGFGLAQRMARERDILGSLEHPHIARLYDAGSTAEGRPWMAMERVSGVAIDSFCSEANLDVPQRLRLFLQVSDAVSHAHARLVVHRDLKPSNILVTADGEVRLLDFGVATLLQDDGPAATSLTQLIGRAVTPDYASPEQVSGKPVGVATDVYSLAIVLYELLTGQRPYQLDHPSAAAMEAAILAADIPPASTRVLGPPGQARALAKQLRGDLDTVLAKALRKDSTKRYASVESFAADLKRHLDGEPVLARPSSRRYRAAKFVVRHRVAMAAGSAVAMSLLIGLGMAVWQAQSAARQTELAYARLAQTEAVSEFMNAVLTENVQTDEQISLKQLIARSEAVADAAAVGSSTERAVGADAVAGWYISYGDYAKAEQLVSRTLAALPPDFDSGLANTLRCKRAHALSHLGPIEPVLKDLAQAIEASRGDPATASACLRTRAVVARNANDATGSLADMLESWRLFNLSGGRSASTRALLLSELGYAYSLNGQAAQADHHYATAVSILSSIGRGESPLAVTALNNWAIALLNAGDPTKALALFDQAQAITARRAPGGQTPGYLAGNRGHALRALARYDDALAAYDQMIESARRQGNANYQAFGLVGKAAAYQKSGQWHKVQPELDAARAVILAGQLPPNGPVSWAHRYVQATVWHKQGRTAEARTALAEVFDAAQRSGLRIGGMVYALIARSELDLDDGRTDEALKAAESALAVAREVQGGTPFSNVTGQAWMALAHARRAAGQGVSARDAYGQAAQHLAHTVGAAHPMAQRAQQLAAATQAPSH